MANTLNVGGINYNIKGSVSDNTAPIIIDGKSYNIQDANDYFTVEDIDNIVEVPASNIHTGSLAYNKKDGLLYVYKTNTWEVVADHSVTMCQAYVRLTPID